MLRTRLNLVVGALALLTGLQSVRIAAREAVPHVLRDIDGVVLGSIESHPGWKWTVLFFLMTDCPIGNRYAAEIQRICTAYGPGGAQCFLVYVDPDLKPADIRTHMQEFKYTCCHAILDSRHELVDKAGATVVSEVAVFGPGADLRYRGRIDDLFAGLGKPRQVVTHHDLRDALDALVANRNLANPLTQAFGCFIPPKPGK